MTRPIKFRAWDENKKQMIFGGSITAWLQAFLEQGRPRSGGVRQTIHKDLHFLQFTGLTDKNGKEIYEGDVVGHDTVEYKDDFAEVKFVDGCFYAEFRYDGRTWFELVSRDRIIVIGNIYENPELLK